MSQPSAEMFHAAAIHEDQKLVALGVYEHFNDPNSPQFDKIVEAWQGYLGQEPDDPIVVIEGGVREPRFSTDPNVTDEVLSVRQDGEMCLMSTLAYKADVPCITGEPVPRYSEIYDVLASTGEMGIDPSTVFYTYWVRNVPQLVRMQPQPSVDDFFGGNRLPRFADLQADYSYENMTAIHQHLYGVPFNPADIDLQELEDGHPDVGIVAHKIYEQRDRALGETVVRLWNQGRDPFVLYHRGHLESAITHELLANIPNYSTSNI